MNCSQIRTRQRTPVCREFVFDRIQVVEIGTVIVTTRRPRCAVISVTVTYWGTA